jgi:hypothetical protein
VFAVPASDGAAAKRLQEVLLGGLRYQDRTEWLYTELYLIDDATYLARPEHTDSLLNLCEKWEAAARDATDPAPDRSFLTFRAIGHLRRGEYEAAANDLAEAKAAFAAGHCWVDPRPLDVYLHERRELPEFLESVHVLAWNNEDAWRMQLNCPPPEH